ncbi:MAG: phosphatidate cytidylyltransferase [Steroidobacteraceae bacterium]|nr:phosphatidate cytidylyltransferase [Steroidobacteraceae bacterium]
MAEGLRKRVTTAVVLVAILLAVLLWLPPIATVIALTLIVLAGAWEWSAFLHASGIAFRLLYVALIAVLLPVIWQLTAQPAGRDALLFVALAWWIIALAWVVFAPRRVSWWSAALAGVLALVPAWLALTRMRLDFVRGAEWVLFALILVWVADIGAFFVGRRYGHTRLAPKVSPGKTWEGVAGGTVASAVVALIGSGWFDIPAARFVPLCIAAVAFSIVGDLTESLLKRFAGVKDSGTLFPGHGGVMDRIDSVTGAAPVLFLGLVTLGVSP